jgi:hypothetical protein
MQGISVKYRGTVILSSMTDDCCMSLHAKCKTHFEYLRQKYFLEYDVCMKMRKCISAGHSGILTDFAMNLHGAHIPR